MIERVSIMSTARDHSNIAPIFHPAESWQAERERQLVVNIVYSALFFVCGAVIRIMEYSLLKNQAKQSWYEQNIIFHNFVRNNPFKDTANMLPELWSLIIAVTLVTAFLETKTAEFSHTATAFYHFVYLLSGAIDFITGYISPDTFNQNDFGLSLSLIIIGFSIATFALNYGVKFKFSTRVMQENETLRSDHLEEYHSLPKGSLFTKHPITDAILRPIFGLTLMTTLATFIACGIAALFARMGNHLVIRVTTLIIAVVLELILSSIDRGFMLQIGAYGHSSKRNQTRYKRHKFGKLIYHFSIAALSYFISLLPFSLVLNPTTTLMLVVTLLIPILIFVFYQLPCWDWFLAPLDKLLLTGFIKDDQKDIEHGHFRLYTEVTSTYIDSELSIDTHREHLLHTVITHAKRGEWAKICYPASPDTKQVPLLSLSVDELRKNLGYCNSQRNNATNQDAPKHQRDIMCLVDKIDTNDREFDCCNQEECKIYLAAIFNDPRYLSTSISSEADKEERPKKVITHNFPASKESGN